MFKDSTSDKKEMNTFIKDLEKTGDKVEENEVLAYIHADTAEKAEIAIADGSADADKAVVAAVSTIDKACAKGVLHKNTAARKVSKMMKAANAAK